MRFFSYAAATLLAATGLASAAAVDYMNPRHGKISPKFFIISMFGPEADIWYTKLPSSGLGNLYAHNISVPGLSPIYEHIHCTADYQICQVTLGESEINAATTVTSLLLSDKFDFKLTYFMIAGIAGVNPKYATLGSVTFARYAVQVALQYEFDAREIPSNLSTGYIPFGAELPNQYPTTIYGTEVFEVNQDLQKLAAGWAGKATLEDNAVAQEYRLRYAAPGGKDALYAAATKPPSVVLCDVATSDVYYSGTLLSEAFENTTTLFTNGTGKYCTTAQEDNATLEVMVRLAVEGKVDYSRVIVMRTASDFDRPPYGESSYDNLLIADQNGFGIAIDNIFNAGIEVVKGILDGWNHTFRNGVKPSNYVGDIFGTLGGAPDFGPGSIFGGKGILPGGKSASSKRMKREVKSRRDMIAGGSGRGPAW